MWPPPRRAPHEFGRAHIAVAVQDDFLAQQTYAQPIAALAELIWKQRGCGMEIGVPAPRGISTFQQLGRQHLRFASTHDYIAAMDLKFWQ
ncbi:MAG TPA: hypothetical protein VFQ06_14855 [Nitrospira sp.]|nr:hypothetical protein [Nitrospira sp.]